MKYCYSISKPKTFNFNQTAKIFPDNFLLQQENEETFIIVETEEKSQSEVFKQVQRECDRIFFIVGEQLNPIFKWSQNPNEPRTCQQIILSNANIIAPISENITPQDWKDSNLAVQLRLWQAAQLSNLPISAKINRLFQIIEIDYPLQKKDNYPEYCDSNIEPLPMTEAKLLRHLVSHAGEPYGDELKEYCEFLKIPEIMNALTDQKFMQAIASRFHIVEKQAREIINGKITFVEK